MNPNQQNQPQDPTKLPQQPLPGGGQPPTNPDQKPGQQPQQPEPGGHHK